jgi:hypothetical protein
VPPVLAAGLAVVTTTVTTATVPTAAVAATASPFTRSPAAETACCTDWLAADMAA